MAEYVNFVAFRIKEDQSYDARRSELMDRIKENAVGKWWKELTSMVIFPCNLSPAQLAPILKPAINLHYDLIAVGSLTHQELVIVGDNRDDDIFSICSFARPTWVR